MLSLTREVANLSAHRSLFEGHGIKLCIANDSLIKICHYKDKFNQWIEKEMPEIAVKTFSRIEDIGDTDYPSVCKTCGRQSKYWLQKKFQIRMNFSTFKGSGYKKKYNYSAVCFR